MSELLELAARCGAAEGPDRELDIAIALALPVYRYGEQLGRFYNAGPRYEGADDQIGFVTHGESERIEPGNAPDMMVPGFTASLDAAMMLVPEGWTRTVKWSVENEGYALVYDPAAPDDTSIYAIGKTEALALCAAALRAWSVQP